MGRSTENKRLNFIQNFICGGIAGTTSRTFTAPFNVVKIQNQVGTCQARQGFIWTVIHIYRTEGKMAFWKGNLTACVRLFPFTAIQFSMYNSLKQPFLDRRGMVHPIGSFIAGSAAGVAATLFTYPLDVIKTRLTIQGGLVGAKHYSGMVDALRMIAKQEGTFALYKGVFPSVMGIVPLAGTMFMAYEILDRVLTRGNHETHPFIHFFNGMTAAFMAQTVAYPFDTIRKKLQVQSNFLPTAGVIDIEFNGMVDCAYQIYTKTGLTGLWAGYFANYMKMLPYAGLMFLSYELSKNVFLKTNGY